VRTYTQERFIAHLMQKEIHPASIVEKTSIILLIRIISKIHPTLIIIHAVVRMTATDSTLQTHSLPLILAEGHQISQ